jgi:hypothetical protein
MVTLAGTEYANHDGTSRQEVVAQCALLEMLRLQPEPNNKFDPNAVGVFRSNGQQLGYLPRRVAAETVARMKKGFRHAAVVVGVRPSSTFIMRDDTTTNPCEVVIALFVLASGVSAEEWRAYYQTWATGDWRSEVPS